MSVASSLQVHSDSRHFLRGLNHSTPGSRLNNSANVIPIHIYQFLASLFVRCRKEDLRMKSSSVFHPALSVLNFPSIFKLSKQIRWCIGIYDSGSHAGTVELTFAISLAFSLTSLLSTQCDLILQISFVRVVLALFSPPSWRPLQNRFES